MATAQPIPETALRITRTFRARRERVFRAWTEPEALKRWFAPDDTFDTRVLHFDPRPGGRYRVDMRKDDASHIVAGEYREVRPPERLVFTWKWENHPERGTEDTIVTLEFYDQGESTELVLTHERFPDIAARDEHNKGWTGCLDRLGRYVSERSAS